MELIQPFGPVAEAKPDMLVIPVFIPHSGCPHHCLFCNQEKISGATGTSRSVREITETIDEWLARCRPRPEVQVAFFGGSFTCLPEEEQKRLLLPVQPYLDTGQVQTIRISTRPDCISPSVIALLQELRVGVVELGGQSMNQRVLEQSYRGHSAATVEAAFQMLRAAGFSVGVQLMIGLPGETRRSFLRGVDTVVAMCPDLIRLYPTVVVEGSGLARLYRDGQYRPLRMAEAIVLCKRALLRFNEAGIPVARMGLQASEELAASIVAGPFHPAFGELVRSLIWQQNIRKKLATLNMDEHLEVHVSHRDYSSVVGRRKINIKRLAELGFSNRFTLIAHKEIRRGSVHYAVSSTS